MTSFKPKKHNAHKEFVNLESFREGTESISALEFRFKLNGKV